jgi:hypothetical protein
MVDAFHRDLVVGLLKEIPGIKNQKVLLCIPDVFRSSEKH